MPVRALRFTRRGWALVWASCAFMVLGTFLNRREGLFVGIFLLLVVALCAVSVSVQKVPLRLERRRASDGSCGEPLDVVCELRTQGSGAVVSGWTDIVPRTFGTSPTGILPPQQMSRSARAAIRYRVVPSVRGQYSIGPFRVTLTDPLGLSESVRQVGHDTSGVLVLPRVSELAHSELLASAGDGRMRDRTRPTAPRADELIARDYRPGDPLRRVHWRATARHGQLMVRQEEPQADPEALIVIDVGTDRTRIDALVDMAASVAVHLSHSGYRVTFAESGSDWVTSSPGDTQEILTALAVWHGSVVEAPREMARRIEQRFSDRIPIVVMTTDVDRLGDLHELVTHAAPAIAFVATGSGISQDAVTAPWLASGLADRRDVSASWDRLNRKLVHG